MNFSEINDLAIGNCLSESLNGEVYEAVLDGRDVIYRIPPTGSIEGDIYKKYYNRKGMMSLIGFYQGGLVLEKGGKNLGECVNHPEMLITYQQFDEVAGFLDVLHSDGYLHRDIQPGNLVTKHHKFCLIDFGLTRTIESRGDKVDPSHTVLRYASINQLKGINESICDDNYSFALCLAYAFSKKTPWGTLGGAPLISTINMDIFPRDYGLNFRNFLAQLSSDLSYSSAKIPFDVYSILSEM
ncbi:MAG: protein kinase [Deltaproteobacteria bacterium]|nr:protein kinase [Deltaproteobacteria bacterium]